MIQGQLFDDMPAADLYWVGERFVVQVPHWLCKAKGWPSVRGRGNTFEGTVLKKTDLAILFRPDGGLLIDDWLPLSRIELERL